MALLARPPVILGFIILLGIILRWPAGPAFIDDAYITFRYARNLANGHGLVFNLGEPVLGTTTPLWAFLLAGLYQVTGLEIPDLAFGLSIAADALSIVLVAHLAAQFTKSHWWGLGAGLLLALSPVARWASSSGMETSLFAALLLGTFAVRDRPRLWPVLAALATLTRPEGVLLALVLLVTNRRQAVRSGLLYGALLLPWAVAATAVYGSPLPHSMQAKAAPIYNLPWLIHLARYVGSAICLLSPTLPSASALVVLLVWGSVRPDRPRLMLPVWLFPLSFLAFYLVYVLRGGLLFSWYLLPLTPWVLLLAVTVLAHRTRKRGALWATAMLAILLAGQLVPFSASSREHEATLQAATQTLIEQAPPGAVVAAPEIGAVGWAAPSLYILDTAGLVSPSALRYYPLPEAVAEAQLKVDYLIPAQLLIDAQPDCILTLRPFIDAVHTTNPEALAEYQVTQRWPLTTPAREVLLYKRTSPTH